MHCGCRATQQGAPAKIYMQNKSNTMTAKQNQFPRQECGCCSDCKTNDGISFFLSFFVGDQLNDFIETSKEQKGKKEKCT